MTPKTVILTVFALSWLSALVFALMGQTMQAGNIYSVAFGSMYMLIPALVVIFLYVFKKRGNFRQQTALYFKPNRWFVVAWLLPLAITILVVAINTSMPNITFSWAMSGYIDNISAFIQDKQQSELIQQQLEQAPIHPVIMATISALVAGLTINALFALGEELFWRGYLYEQLKALGFWRMSLVVGFLWGVWHAPIIMLGHNYPNYPIAGVFMMTLWSMLLAPMFTYIRMRSGSVISAAILHGSINAFAGIPLMLIIGGSSLINGWLGLSGVIVLFFINLWLYFVVKRSDLMH